MPPAITQVEQENCGNGVLESGEQCDDGNRKSGDGCSDICQVELVAITKEKK